MVRAQTTSYADSGNSKLPKETKSNKENPAGPKPAPLKFTQMSRTSTGGKSSEARHLEHHSHLCSSRPTQTQQGMPQTQGNGFLLWKENTAEMEAAESCEGTVSLSGEIGRDMELF